MSVNKFARTALVQNAWTARMMADRVLGNQHCLPEFEKVGGAALGPLVDHGRWTRPILSSADNGVLCRAVDKAGQTVDFMGT